MQQHNKLTGGDRDRAGIGDTGSRGVYQPNEAGGAGGAGGGSGGGGTGLAVPSSLRGGAAVPGSTGAPVTIGGGGGEAHALYGGPSKVAVEGAQAQAVQQEVASQLAAVARKVGTFKGVDAGQ